MTIKKLAIFTVVALVLFLAAVGHGDWPNELFWGAALALDGTALWRAFRREAGDIE